jgi:hypothetical protein
MKLIATLSASSGERFANASERQELLSDQDQKECERGDAAEENGCDEVLGPRHLVERIDPADAIDEPLETAHGRAREIWSALEDCGM